MSELPWRQTTNGHMIVDAKGQLVAATARPEVTAFIVGCIAALQDIADGKVVVESLPDRHIGQAEQIARDALEKVPARPTPASPEAPAEDRRVGGTVDSATPAAPSGEGTHAHLSSSRGDRG